MGLFLDKGYIVLSMESKGQRPMATKKEMSHTDHIGYIASCGFETLYLTLSPVSRAPLAMTGWLQTIGLQVGSTSAVSSEYHVPYLQEMEIFSNDDLCV